MVVRREPPLTFAALEPIVVRSHVARLVGRALDGLVRFAAEARAVTIATRLIEQMRLDRTATLVKRGAWLIAVAAMTHIAMLLFLERYHFPSRSAFVLPAVIVVGALLVTRMGSGIASAIEDRSQR